MGLSIEESFWFRRTFERGERDNRVYIHGVLVCTNVYLAKLYPGIVRKHAGLDLNNVLDDCSYKRSLTILPTSIFMVGWIRGIITYLSIFCCNLSFWLSFRVHILQFVLIIWMIISHNVHFTNLYSSVQRSSVITVTYCRISTIIPPNMVLLRPLTWIRDSRPIESIPYYLIILLIMVHPIVGLNTANYHVSKFCCTVSFWLSFQVHLIDNLILMVIMHLVHSL